MKRLLEIGFEQVGRWHLLNKKLALELTRMSAQRNVVYAFIQDAIVLYVGKTTGTLETRMGGYLRPHSSQRTNVRNNLALVELLQQEKAVEIYAWADSGIHRIGEFHLNYAAGLEDSIIKTILPPWNGARSTQQAGIELSVLSSSVAMNDDSRLAEAASEIELQDLEAAGVIKASPVFEVVLGKTYYNNGFFNVPVKFSDRFPEHGTEISIYCGDSRTLIRATVDRKANQANHTPRIYGRGSLTNWFGRYKRPDGIATIRIVSLNEIELM